MVAGKSPEWLPPGFAQKVKYKNGRKIKYYYNVATGAKYHSKKDVLCATADDGLLGTPQTTRGDDNGLSSNNKLDATLVKTNNSPDWLPNGWIMEERARLSGSREGSTYKVYTDSSSGSRFYSRAAVTRYLNTVNHANTMTVQNKELDNVDEPSPNMSLQSVSMTNTDSISEKKRKGNSFKTVATVRTAAEDLPPGWIKEIRTSKSGNKIRKDPYYTDPVSGYVFRSKVDALRYLKTNDIGSCSCKPKKRELDDLKLIHNEIPPSSPTNRKSSEHKGQLFSGEELNGGGENFGTKSVAESEEKISCENPKNNAEVENNNHEPANEDPRVMAVTDPLTKQQQLSESGMDKQTDRTQIDLRKSKKRKDLSLPSRTSKRLAGCEPEIKSNSPLNERSLKAAAKRSSISEVDIEPANEDEKHAFIGNETLQEIEQVNKINDPSTEEPAIPEEQTGGDDSKRPQESQVCYDFGESWSDPLAFAFKTLRGEIPIEDTLPFPSFFDGPSQTDILFRNEFAPNSESSKQHGAVDQFPPNSSSFSALGNISFPSCSGFNGQSTSEAAKKDSQTKFNP